jgi:hypothetical protein
MGHDHHFLERLDRIAGDQLDVALDLYRNHEAVKYILEHLSLRPGHDRIALSLGRLDKGPYVVLATNGHFVTCLGEGMSAGGLDIVPRERVHELIERHRDMKGRLSVRDNETRKNENRREFFGRLFRRGNALTREEFVALSAFSPILGRSLYLMSIDESKYVLDHIPNFLGVTKIDPKHMELAKLFHDAMWNAGHCMLLAAMGAREEVEEELGFYGPKGNISTHTAVLGSTTILLRSAWAGSRVGKRLVPSYERGLRMDAQRPDQAGAVVGLLALALRDKTLTKGITRMLEEADAEWNEAVPNEPGKETVARSAIKVLEDPDDNLRRAVIMGRQFYRLMSDHLPDGDPYKFAKEEDVPHDLAATALLSIDLPLYDMPGLVLTGMPLAVMASAEDFYFPREVAKRVLADWTPEMTLYYMDRLKGAIDLSQKPKRVEQKVGRNELCPCGSGKKYKKCHGA